MPKSDGSDVFIDSYSHSRPICGRKSLGALKESSFALNALEVTEKASLLTLMTVLGDLALNATSPRGASE